MEEEEEFGGVFVLELFGDEEGAEFERGACAGGFGFGETWVEARVLDHGGRVLLLGGEVGCEETERENVDGAVLHKLAHGEWH